MQDGHGACADTQPDADQPSEYLLAILWAEIESRNESVMRADSGLGVGVVWLSGFCAAI